MKRIVSFLFLLSLVLTACNAPAASAENTPAPYPDTPSPPEINAPLVDGPAIVSIDFLNSLDGWAVTETQVVRTNDGGITWYNVTPPNVTETGYSVKMFILDNSHVWVHKPDFDNYPNSGFLYRTTDGGLTWTDTTTPFSGGDIQFLDANNGWALADLGVGAGSNAVAVYQTTDGGAGWHQTYTNDPNDTNAGDSLPLGGLKFGIASNRLTHAWVYGVVYAPGSPYLFVTDNAGHIWSPVSLPLPQGAEGSELSIENVRFVSPDDAFLVMRVASDTSEMAVYTSNDAGNTWALTPTLIPDGGSSVFTSANEAVIYNGNQFYVTKDAARTWSIIPPDVKFGDTFAAMDFSDPNNGWVLTLDPTTGDSTLYRSGDGGATWFPVVP